VAFNPTGSLLASAGWDKSIRLWDAASRQCVRTLIGHNGWILAVAFDQSGPILASAGDDRTVRLWNTVTGHCIQILEGHSDDVNGVAFSPNGSLVASASQDRSIMGRGIWKMLAHPGVARELGQRRGL
jgi:WD40 repeat protein